MGGERTLPDDQLSYSKFVPELMAADHVLLAVRAETAARVVNEMSVFPKTPRWHLTPALRTEAFVLNASPAALADAIGVSPDVEVEPEFATAFSEYWDGDMPLESALFYYDAMALFAMGYERAHRKQMGAPSAAQLAESIFAVSFPNGVATRWSELAASIGDLRQGQVRYYRGLTGSIVLAPCPSPAVANGGGSAVGLRHGQCEGADGFEAIGRFRRRQARDDLAGLVGSANLRRASSVGAHAAQQIGRDRDVPVLGQLIGHGPHPVLQAVDLHDHDDDRRLVRLRRIGNPRFEAGPARVGDVDPLALLLRGLERGHRLLEARRHALVGRPGKRRVRRLRGLVTPGRVSGRLHGVPRMRVGWRRDRGGARHRREDPGSSNQGRQREE
jgi:hypothetical protein